jgi:hypothetical protein
MNTRGELGFIIIPCCYNCDYISSHIIVHNKQTLESRGQTLEPTSCEPFFN